MFFKNKGKNNKESEGLKVCESPTCPTPSQLHPKEILMVLDGLNLCQFCYTRHLSENTIENVIQDVPKTKKVVQVETNRIGASPIWSLKNQSTSGLSRIGPSNETEKYAEEVNTWEDILLNLNFDIEYASVKSVTRLSKTLKTRLLDTSGGFLIISFITKEQYSLKKKEITLQQELFSKKYPELITFDLGSLSNRNKDWLINNHILNSDASSQEVLVASKHPNTKIFTLEEMTEAVFSKESKESLVELGKYFYFLNFIGAASANQLVVIMTNMTISFFNANYNFAKETFQKTKSMLQEIYLAMPFILDQENLEPFLEGASKQQEFISNILTKNGKEKALLEKFFKDNNIIFDQSKKLANLESFF